MRIGLDLDNTIICYDGVFDAVGCRLGLLPAKGLRDKPAVRAYLRAQGREEDWTRLQGLVYGRYLEDAGPYPGVVEFLKTCRATRAEVFVVSHRTRAPILGDAYDLHTAARQWLAGRGFHAPEVGLPVEHVFLEAERAGKLERIASLACDVFVDDLTDVLADPAFPAAVRRILFDPVGPTGATSGLEVAGSWGGVEEMLFGRRV